MVRVWYTVSRCVSFSTVLLKSNRFSKCSGITVKPKIQCSGLLYHLHIYIVLCIVNTCVFYSFSMCPNSTVYICSIFGNRKKYAYIIGLKFSYFVALKLLNFRMKWLVIDHSATSLGVT
jgi:hypothetical protein